MLLYTVLCSKPGQEATALFIETMPSTVIEPATHAGQETLISISDPCACPSGCQGDLLHLRSAETLKGIWRGGCMKQGADIYWEYNNVEWKEGLQ